MLILYTQDTEAWQVSIIDTINQSNILLICQNIVSQRETPSYKTHNRIFITGSQLTINY